jgi:8-oxo-dGTP diphosphatase
MARQQRRQRERLRKDLKGKLIRAAGGIVWKRTARGRRLAVIRRVSRDNAWSLPKGKLKPGESWRKAALREIREEICCDVKVLGVTGTISYLVKGVPKVVLFLEMRLRREHEFVASKEVDELRWVSPAEARRLIRHPEERKLIIAP